MIFHAFEEPSGIYVTTKLVAADLDRAATPKGCVPGMGRINDQGKSDRCPAFAVDSALSRTDS